MNLNKFSILLTILASVWARPGKFDNTLAMKKIENYLSNALAKAKALDMYKNGFKGDEEY